MTTIRPAGFGSRAFLIWLCRYVDNCFGHFGSITCADGRLFASDQGDTT